MTLNYPNDADGRALRRLADSGVEMSQPTAIDFFVTIADEASANCLAERASELGCRTSVYRDEIEDDAGALWTCECTKDLVPTYDALIAEQAAIDAFARPYGGYADGWGAFRGDGQYIISSLELEPPVPSPARRPFQYSLRTLLLIMTGLAVVLGLLYTPTRSQRIAQQVGAMDGYIDVARAGPDFWRNWFGKRTNARTMKWWNGTGADRIVGPFDSVTSVRFDLYCRVPDEWLDNLAGVASLEALEFYYAGTTDEGILRLHDLPNLKCLDLSGLPITDRCLPRISTFTKLETLRLDHTQVSGGWIFELGTLQSLSTLDLQSTNVDDAAIADLKELRSLSLLDLTSTKVSHKGITELRAALPNCEVRKYNWLEEP